MATATEAPANAEGPTSHTQNQPAPPPGYTQEEQLKALQELRAPFQDSEIRYRPQLWCSACKETRGQCCFQHQKARCGKCNQTLSPAHSCLRFVGHAEATQRLLNVDPLWDWEPMATDDRGLPQYDANRGLWIRLTVCGMTRIGYGDAGGKTGGNAVKEIIGDAIRNAGMRFGMALDLWKSSDLAAADAAAEEAQQSPEQRLEQLLGWTRIYWGHLDRLREIRTWVGEENFRESQIPTSHNDLREFGDVLDERIRELVDRAMKPAGTPSPQPSPSQQDASPSESLPSEPAGKPDETAELDRLTKQAQAHWNKPIILEQVKGAAAKADLLDHLVEGPPDWAGEWMAFGQLLTRRLDELAAAKSNDTERSAA